MTCDELINAYLKNLREGFFCKTQPNGRLCVVTPYLYPDHDNIEIYARISGDGVNVSDRGETLRRLDTIGLDVCGTPNAFFAANRIVAGVEARIDRGIIVKHGPLGAIGTLVFDVLWACQAVASLAYGSRAYEPLRFEEQVKDYLEAKDLKVQEGVSERGNSGSLYRVSFRVIVQEQSFLVSTISPKSAAGVRSKVNYNFRMWSDINGTYPNGRKINLLNDDDLTFKTEDANILERVSTIHRWKKREALLAALTAPKLPLNDPTIA